MLRAFIHHVQRKSYFFATNRKKNGNDRTEPWTGMWCQGHDASRHHVVYDLLRWKIRVGFEHSRLASRYLIFVFPIFVTVVYAHLHTYLYIWGCLLYPSLPFFTPNPINAILPLWHESPHIKVYVTQESKTCDVSISTLPLPPLTENLFSPLSIISWYKRAFGPSGHRCSWKHGTIYPFEVER